ncbi:GAF domain-containing protein [Undibacterium sp. FT137W]|uniref:histidine kinase n=2 Tax=Undibacterium fentianense TaxID=2828728 RepID=A0A941E477_9BURK|nr:GAF domain-containing protein [Undibacterium fentianense]
MKTASFILHRLFWLAIFILSLFQTLTPASAGALHRLRFDHFSIDQGLPSTGILSIYQTRNGFVWLGTSNGLTRYDGRHIRLYSHVPGNAGTISHDRIFSLFEDSQQRLWIGTRRGIDVLDLKTDTIRRIAMPASFTAKEMVVYGIVQDGTDALWIASGAGLLRFNITAASFTRWRSQSEFDSYLSGEARSIIADPQGGIWFGQGQWVVHLGRDGQLLSQFKAAEAEPNLQQNPTQRLVRSLALDDQGQLWVGLTGGLTLWNVKNTAPRSVALPLQLKVPSATVAAILQDHEKSIWLAMGNDQGLLRWKSDKNTLERFVNLPSVSSSLSGDNLTALMLDASGGLWIGTSDYGANLVDLKGRGFTTYLSIPGDPRSLSQRLVTAVLADSDEYAWIGTLGGGLNRLHLPSGDTQRIPKQVVGVEYIRALMLDEQKQLWIGGERLQIFDPKTQRSREIELEKNFPVGARITAIVKAREGLVWVGTSNGLYQINSAGKVTIFRTDTRPQDQRENWLQDDAVDSLLIDREQTLWVGTKGALYRFHPTTQDFQMIRHPSHHFAASEKMGITSLRQDQHGRIWAATILAGLVEVKPTLNPQQTMEWEYVLWKPSPALPDDVIEAMQDAENGEIWMSSERGLMRLEPALNRARNFPAFGRFEGAFNFASATRARDGALLFGGVGLVYFHPEAIWENPIPPRVVLSDILLFNKSLSIWSSKDALAKTQRVPSPNGTASRSGANDDLASIGVTGPLSAAKRVQLNHQQSMVSFELAALHFYNKTHLRYAWKLAGYDQDWIYGQSDRSIATYTNLDAGTYHLVAKAANPDGVWSEGTEILELVVLPPFWRTWWWYGMWIMVVLLGLRYAYHRRLASVRANQVYLEQQIKSQTQEVLEQKKLAIAQREIAEQARNDIGRLSEIGLKMTSSLERQQILDTLYANIKTMIPASTFGVGIVDWDKRSIAFDYTIQGDQVIQPYERSLDALEQPSTRCVLTAQELIINEIEHDSRKLDQVIAGRTGESDVKLVDGTVSENSRSGIYVPILMNGRVMGLIGALSVEKNVFGLNDLNILRTLAAYTGVALDNADAYRRLKITQSKLVEQEKLAALGSLVAGVAHELNTPIGNSLLMASTMQELSQQFMSQVKQNQIKRSDLENYCLSSVESSDLMVRSLSSAANLVSSFKQIAVDQTSDKRREFDLRYFCEEVALTLSNRSKREGHEIVLDVASGLNLDSYPGSLGQVLNNLILNAMIHGLNEHPQGKIQIRANPIDLKTVSLVVEDNGAGIARDNIERIFEPFFTTKLGTGGSGLGLHIVYNIVHSVLGGSIQVESEVGRGTRFTIQIPFVAPMRKQNDEEA